MISCSEPGGTTHLVPNLIHYARLRWQKGLAVNAAQIADAAQGLAHGDLARCGDDFHKLHGILIFRQSGT